MMNTIQEAIEVLDRLRCYEYRGHDSNVCMAYIHDGLQLAKRLELINSALLDALEISTTTLQVVYKADRNNISAKACIERNHEAIRKAQT